MPSFEDDLDRKPAPKPVHEIGEVLDRLSLTELQARIALLRQEIERLEQAVVARAATQAAASSFFKSDAADRGDHGKQRPTSQPVKPTLTITNYELESTHPCGFGMALRRSVRCLHTSDFKPPLRAAFFLAAVVGPLPLTLPKSESPFSARFGVNLARMPLKGPRMAHNGTRALGSWLLCMRAPARARRSFLRSGSRCPAASKLFSRRA